MCTFSKLPHPVVVILIAGGYIYNIVVEEGEGAEGMPLAELETMLEGVADAGAGLDWLLGHGPLYNDS